MAEELAINGGPKTATEGFPSTGNASGRDLGDEEIALVTEVIRSGKMFRYSGTMVEQFEKEYAEFLGIKHVQAVTSGSASLNRTCHRSGTRLVTAAVMPERSISPFLSVPAMTDS